MQEADFFCCSSSIPCFLACLLQVGFKLLAADVKIASRLAHKVLHGKNLTRWGCRDCCCFPISTPSSV